MRLIDEKDIRLFAEVKKTMKINARIEYIVVITDNAIHPQSQIQRKFKGANFILPGDLLDHGTGKCLMLVNFRQGYFRLVKIATGKHTYFRVAVDRRTKTDLFLSSQGYAS